VADPLEEMVKIRKSLNEGMVLFDLPEFASGYYALLAIQSIHKFPEESVILIPREMMDVFLNKLAIFINEKMSQDVLRVTLDTYLNDLRAGEMPLNTALLPFVYAVLDLPQITIVSSDDATKLGEFYSKGVLIQSRSDYFFVALPKYTVEGVEITEIICEDQDGVYSSLAGKLANEF
jgi:hypothetical protein